MTDKRIRQAIDKNLSGLTVTEGEMQQLITRAYQGDRPRRQLRVVLVTALILLLLAATALAVIQMSRVVVSRDMSDMAVYNGRLILYKWRQGLTELDPDTGEEQPLVIKNQGQFDQIAVSKLLADEERLYLLSQAEQAIYPVEVQNGSALIRNPVKLKGLPLHYAPSILLAEGRLYLLREGLLTWHPLTGEEGGSQNLQNITRVTAFGPGRLAGIQEKRVNGRLSRSLVIIDLANFDISPLASLDPALRVSALAYLKGGPLVFEANNALFAVNEQGQVREAASLVRGDVIALYMLDSQRAAVALDSLVVIRSILEEENGLRLTVLDPLGRGEDYSDFIRNHPDIGLQFPVFSVEDTKERFIRDMLTRSDEIDVYVLKDLNLMQVIKDKGYGLDLMKDPALADFARGLYPLYQDYFMQEGGLFGLPKAAHPASLAYNPAAFKELNLPVPTTYAEFFRLALQIAKGQIQRDAKLQFSPRFYGATADRLLTLHVDEQVKNGLPIKVNTPAMGELLHLYQQVIALDQGDLRPEIHLFHYVDLPYRGEEHRPLPLPIQAGNTPVISYDKDSFSYFVVNPYSRHQKEALAFLSSYVRNMPPFINIRLTQGISQPVEAPDYRQRYEDLTGRLVDLKERLKTASGAEQSTLEKQVETTEAMLNNLEAYERYLITQQDIEDFRKVAPLVALSPKNPILALMAQYPALFDEIDTNPNLDVDSFLARLEDMLAIMDKEEP